MQIIKDAFGFFSKLTSDVMSRMCNGVVKLDDFARSAFKKVCELSPMNILKRNGMEILCNPSNKHEDNRVQNNIIVEIPHILKHHNKHMYLYKICAVALYSLHYLDNVWIVNERSHI